MIFQIILISSMILAIKSDALLNPCSSNPCLNGATCLSEHLTSYRCLCPSGYSGDECQKKKISSEEDNSNESGPFKDKKCLNGGKFIKAGLPCICPDGYVGMRCEIYSSNKYCTSNTCFNDGICLQLGKTFRCECQNFYHGPRCEFSRAYGYNRRTTGISSFSSLLMTIGLVALIAYCFCFKQKRNETGPFIQGNSRFSGFILRPGNVSCPYPQAPFYNQNQSNSNFNYPNYVNTPNRLPQTPIPDPEEAYRVNQAPPSYEEAQKMKNNIV